MNKARDWLFRGRHLLVLLEVVLAGGCGYAGWRITKGNTPPAVTIQRRAPAAVPGGSAGRFEAVEAVGGSSGPRGSEPQPIKPSRDLIQSLNRSDEHLYQQEWQVLEMMMGGIRDYIEHRIVPSLFAHN